MTIDSVKNGNITHIANILNLYYKFNNIIKYIFTFIIICISILFTYNTSCASTIIQDDADIISDSEEASLKHLCDNIYDEYDTSIYIWTDNEISGSDNFGYKMEQYVSAKSEKNVIILLIGMHPGDRIYEVQGYGLAQEMINNERCSKILDYMYDDMADGDYYSAIEIFCNKILDYMCDDMVDDDYYSAAESLNSESYTYMDKAPVLDSIIFNSVFQFILCLIAGITVIAVMAYNSGGKTTTNSHTYLDTNNSRVIGSFDRYTHTTTTRVPKPQNNSSSSHNVGSGSHSSGGGRSF